MNDETKMQFEDTLAHFRLVFGQANSIELQGIVSKIRLIEEGLPRWKLGGIKHKNMQDEAAKLMKRAIYLMS